MFQFSAGVSAWWGCLAWFRCFSVVGVFQLGESVSLVWMFQLVVGVSPWCGCISLIGVFQLGVGVSAWCWCFSLVRLFKLIGGVSELKHLLQAEIPQVS